MPEAAVAQVRWRVAFVNTHPIQYFAPLYAHLQSHAGLDVTALYLSDFSLRGGHDKGFGRAVAWDIDLLAGYKPEFMGQRASRRQLGGYFSMVAPELWGAIRRGNFDAVVIHGHNFAAHQVALAACLASATPVLHRSETHLGLRRPRWKEAIRRPLLSRWYRAFDGFLAIGSANARYYRSMGIPAERIHRVPYAVDNERFMAAARQSGESRARVRERLGLQGSAPAILSAAKFEPRKRPDELLEAFRRLQQEGVEAQLVLAGSGQMEPQLKAMVARHGIRNVSFPGFINQAELPQVYAACDVFVLPSDNEPWGLAVNEAMCAGLPVIVSGEIGCAEDLVAGGGNGATFPAGDIAALAGALRPLLVDEGARRQASRASALRIGAWGYAQCAEGLREAIGAARAHRGFA
ncbi:glycosyltransferase family 4 protein [Ramlibacter sp. PS4R-6]|uniref:glycosyltransferase family 4 protein n=1 Tax=Ramlibacter sp. PS4R-6 TaxID=3133438 RepID=UPI0030AE6DF0